MDHNVLQHFKSLRIEHKLISSIWMSLMSNKKTIRNVLAKTIKISRWIRVISLGNIYKYLLKTRYFHFLYAKKELWFDFISLSFYCS